MDNIKIVASLSSLNISLQSEKIQTKRDQKGKSLIDFPKSFVVVDLETSGLDPFFDDIIEISAIKVENDTIVDKFDTLVNGEIDSFITELTGITKAMLKKAPAIEVVLPQFLAFVGDSTIIGHNVNFDINFIYDKSMQYLSKPFANDFIDTMRLSRRLLKQLPHHRLIDLSEFYHVDYYGAHRALIDCEITLSVWKGLCSTAIEQYESLPNCVSEIKKSLNWSKKLDVHTDNTVFDESHPLFGKVVVFTGTLEKMTRKDAMQIVVDLGGIPKNSITKESNYLVLGNNDYCKTITDGKSDKQKKAEQLLIKGADIQIITENVFYDLIDC